MCSDLRRPSATAPRSANRRAVCRHVVAAVSTVGVVAVGLLASSLIGPQDGPLAATPAYASGSADLSVRLENKTDAVPGKRINYRVTVHNAGKTAASRVQIDFITSAALSSVTYSIKNGHCYRSPKETACVFYAALKPGASVSATISGVMPKKLTKGAAVSNRVTLASNTHLINTVDDRASDNYRIGIPRVLATPSASASVSSDSKLLKVTKTASRVLDYSKHALTITFFVLGAAFIWFGVGLALRRRARLARGDYGDDLDA